MGPTPAKIAHQPNSTFVDHSSNKNPNAGRLSYVNKKNDIADLQPALFFSKPFVDKKNAALIE